MVSQQELRAKSLTASADRTQRAVQISSQRKYQEQQKSSETQKETLSSEISKIQKRLNEIQAKISRGRSLTKNERIERAGLEAELNAISSAYEQIDKGGFYQDFSSIISQAKLQSTEAQQKLKSKYKERSEREEILPAGAKIIRTEYIDGERVITYEIPATTKAGVTSQVQSTGEGTISVPPGYSTKEISNLYSSYQSKLTAEQKRKMSQSEQADYIFENTDYKQRVNAIISATPTSQLQESARAMGFTNPEQYGKIITPLPIAESTALSSQAQSVESNLQPTNIIQSQSSPLFSTPTNKLSTYMSQNQINDFVKSETERYQDLGYNERQSKVLATESFNRGGMSFSPSGAKEILIKEQGVVGYYAEEVPKQVTGNIIGFVDTEETDALNKPMFGGLLGEYVKSKGGKVPTTLEFFAFPSEKLDETIEGYKEYSSQKDNIFQFGLSEEQKADEGIKERGRFYRENIFASAVRTAPYMIGGVGVALLTSDIAKGIKKIKNPEEETDVINKVIEEGYKQYSLDYKEEEKNLEEGYELQPMLSKENYKKQIMPEITNQIKIQGATEIAWGGFGLGLAGASQVSKYIPRKKYYGLSEKGYKEFTKQVIGQLDILGSQDVKWISSIDEATGKVKVIGAQTYDDLSRQFIVTGKLGKTESGRVFLPAGEGVSVISGTIKAGKKEVGILGGELFETGSKSGSKFISSIDDIEIYKGFGESTTIPQISTYAFYKPSKFSTKIINKQIGKNIVLGGEVTKEFSPSWILGFGDDASKRIAGESASKVFLDISPTGTGIVIKKTPQFYGESNIILPADITKTPFSRTFGVQELTPSIIKVATPKIIKPNIPIITPPTSSAKTFPFMVGGKGIQVSDVGFNYVSPVEEFSYIRTPSQSILTTPSIDTGKVKIDYLNLETTSELGLYKIKNIITTKPTIRERNILDVAKVSLPKSLQIPSQSFGQISKQTQLQRQKQLQVQLQPQIARQKIDTSIKTRPRIRFSFDMLGGKLKAVPTETNGEFSIFGRRFGKDILLGKARTKKEAAEIFTKFAKGTLGRSGFIESGGKRLSLDELDLGFEFAPAKRDKGRLVQKAKFSLGTGAEVSEIQYFKRKGSKKKSNLFFGGESKWL